MRTVFQNSEVAHVWAQRIQDEGRNSNGSFYFYGDTIYSYGSHFPIATFFYDGTVLMTTQGYSNTTSKHINDVRSAIRHRDIIYCHNIKIGMNNPSVRQKKVLNRENLGKFFDNVIHYAKKQLRARKYSYISDINHELQMAREYVERFGGRNILTHKERALLDGWDEEISAILDIDEAKNKADKKRRAKLERERKKQMQERIADLKEWGKEWRDGEKMFIPHDYHQHFPIMLRLKDDRVETSMRVEILRDEAIKLFRFIQVVKKKGVAWKRNGETFAINRYYQLDWIDADGNFKAGCHTIEYCEAEAMAKQLNII